MSSESSSSLDTNNNISQNKENESKPPLQIKRFEIQKDSCLTYKLT